MVSYESVTLGEGEKEEGERGGERPTHLAFGTKVPIPEHILSSRKSSRSATARQTTVSVKSSVKRDAGDMEIDGHVLRPHPLAEPVDLSIHNIQKKRVESSSREKLVKSSGQSRNLRLNKGLSREAEMDGSSGTDSDGVKREERGMTQTDDVIEEESVLEILNEMETEGGEGLSKKREQHADNMDSETTYLYSSHPKSASSNLMV